MTPLSAREPARGEAAVCRNYALEPGEVDAGYALTCRNPPVSDEITVGYGS
jgi:ring-1,2-phenylacetyl-CoA epoxidase subunit PaaE